jgi:hypothetical protein
MKRRTICELELKMTRIRFMEDSGLDQAKRSITDGYQKTDY